MLQFFFMALIFINDYVNGLEWNACDFKYATLINDSSKTGATLPSFTFPNAFALKPNLMIKFIQSISIL
jgi:hypothetical protein